MHYMYTLCVCSSFSNILTLNCSIVDWWFCPLGLGHQHVRKAKLNLVDLAGSERHGKVGKIA